MVVRGNCAVSIDRLHKNVLFEAFQHSSRIELTIKNQGREPSLARVKDRAKVVKQRIIGSKSGKGRYRQLFEVSVSAARCAVRGVLCVCVCLFWLAGLQFTAVRRGMW